MKNYLRLPVIPLCAGALVIASTLLAQSTPTYNSGSTGVRNEYEMQNRTVSDSNVPRADRRFLTQSVRLGEREVTLSRIAAEVATHPQVRAFAAEMVTAHTSANAELTRLVSQNGTVIDNRDHAIEQRELAKKWNDKKGADFDEDYLEAMIDAHEDIIDALENGVDSKDSRISAYATKQLPSMKAHLAKAEELEKQVD